TAAARCAARPRRYARGFEISELRDANRQKSSSARTRRGQSIRHRSPLGVLHARPHRLWACVRCLNVWHHSKSNSLLGTAPIRLLMDPQDPEITAMSKIGAALTELSEPEAVIRVLRWAVEKYKPKATLPPSRAHNATVTDIGDSNKVLLPPRDLRHFP